MGGTGLWAAVVAAVRGYTLPCTAKRQRRAVRFEADDVRRSVVVDAKVPVG